MASTFCLSADNFFADKIENEMTIKFDMRVTFVPSSEFFICSSSWFVVVFYDVGQFGPQANISTGNVARSTINCKCVICFSLRLTIDWSLCRSPVFMTISWYNKVVIYFKLVKNKQNFYILSISSFILSNDI
jgi:hypothetical protein